MIYVDRRGVASFTLLPRIRIGAVEMDLAGLGVFIGEATTAAAVAMAAYWWPTPPLLEAAR